MSTQSFDIPLAAVTVYSFGSGGETFGPLFETVFDAKRAQEIRIGTSRRKPSGKFIPPTPYMLIYSNYQRAFGSCKIKHETDPGIYYNSEGVVGNDRPFNSLNRFDELLSETDVVEAGHDEKALIKARLSLKASNINLGVAFAERKQTALLLGDTASRLAKSFNHLRRGEVRRAMNDLGISSKKHEPRGSNAPRKWLELQYGWKPLLSDVYGAADALNKRDAGDWRVTAKGRSTGEDRVYSKEWHLMGAGKGVAKAKTQAFCRIDALPSNAGLIALTSLGVTNPLLIIWERVPFSFVVDWALPIGNYLDSLDALLGYTDAFTSTSVLSRGQWSSEGVKEIEGVLTYENSYFEAKRYVRLNRTAGSGVPLPTFPRLKDPRSLGHMANGLALLAGAFASLKR